jgi:hypothetical protein
LVFVLVQQMRHHYLDDSYHAKAQAQAQVQVNTTRLKLFKVAARVIVSVRRVVFHLATCHPNQSLFRDITAFPVLQPGRPKGYRQSHEPHGGKEDCVRTMLSFFARPRRATRHWRKQATSRDSTRL